MALFLSETDDLAVLASFVGFGGGGHKNAAGLRLSGYYEDVVERLLKAVRDEIC